MKQKDREQYLFVCFSIQEVVVCVNAKGDCCLCEDKMLMLFFRTRTRHVLSCEKASTTPLSRKREILSGFPKISSRTQEQGKAAARRARQQ
jgi:hypothetical protein